MRRIRRKRSFDYVLPFLILVGLGVIVVLAFQLWSNLKGASGDVYFYLASGKAKLLPYGTAEWENAYSGTRLLLGDSVKTSQDSRLVLQFYNGTMVRLGDDTQVTLTDLNRRGDSEKIGLALDHGMMWVKRVTTEDIKTSEFDVRTSHMLVRDSGTIFEMEHNIAETVRVLRGSVKVDVLANEENKNQVSDMVQVGVGQQINIDDAVLKAFRARENPSVLMAVADDFKASEWYSWNIQEDETPTDFSHTQKIENTAPTQSLSQVLTQENSLSQQSTQERPVTTEQNVTQQNTQQIVETQEVVVGTLESPVVLKPEAQQRTTDQSKMAITGTVSPGTTKVVVEQKLGGSSNSEEYTLGQFKAGNSSFAYNLNETFNNFKSGNNIYRFYAVDAKGQKSDSTEITIVYNKPKVTEALTAPVVLSFNGGNSSTVTMGVVKVEGEIHGAQKVVVNNFTLGKFEPGSTRWIYYANENGDNLKPGLNEYEAYGIDSDGKESSRVKFTITYNKAGITQGTAQTQQTGTQQKTSPTQEVPKGF